MKIIDFYNKICEYAPLELSEKLCKKDDLYDNSGMIICPRLEEGLQGVLFTLDLSVAAVEKAKKEGCNFIVTHHPAIFSPIKRLELTSALAIAVKYGIAVCSMHLNLDCARYGIDYYFAKGLGAKEQFIIENLGDDTGYGRISSVERITARDFRENYKTNFNANNVWLYGDENRTIDKIASFCGAGLDEEAADNALKYGAQIVVSADVKHHTLIYALNKGLCVLCCTHYATENYGMKRIADCFAKNYKNEKIIFFGDERLS